MEELDLLKKDWQKNNHEDKQFSDNQIYAMIKKQSSSVVKWILVIAVIEFLFGLMMNIFANGESDFEKAGLKKYMFFIDAFMYLNYVVILVFIYYFYKNYKLISTVSDTKTLMKNILKVRKTVNGYIAYNLTILGIFSCIVSILTFMNLPELKGIRVRVLDGEHNLQVCLIIGLIFLLVMLFLFVFWVFYKILYGILLRKLSRNYKELQKIDL